MEKPRLFATGTGDPDFDDVFRGPPNRSFRFGNRHRGESSAVIDSPRSFSFRSARKAHLADGFFQDIFRGAEDDSFLRDLNNQDNGLSAEGRIKKGLAAEAKSGERNLRVSFETAALQPEYSESGIRPVTEEGPPTATSSSCNKDSTFKLKGSKVKKIFGLKPNDYGMPSVGDEVITDKIWRKFKSFFRNFNQDISCKPANFDKPQSRTLKEKEVENIKVEGSTPNNRTNKDIEENITPSISGEEKNNESILVDNNSTKVIAESASLTIDQKVLMSAHEGNEATIWKIDSILDDNDELFGDIQQPDLELKKCTVESLHWEHEHSTFDSTIQEYQNTNIILRDWSSGKEGNIRSLLSTLQYVLWPGSGWKAVPLVDLVDSSSVKKVYMKAMLTLHPDKLQQRGVTMHQKYIAEKVFDILQEAWSQFTSLTPI